MVHRRRTTIEIRMPGRAVGNSPGPGMCPPARGPSSPAALAASAAPARLPPTRTETPMPTSKPASPNLASPCPTPPPRRRTTCPSWPWAPSSISGQISQNEHGLIKGRLGADLAVRTGRRGRATLRDLACSPSCKKACGGDWHRAGPGGEADRLRELHPRFHRPAQGDQRRLRLPRRRAGRRRPPRPLGRLGRLAAAGRRGRDRGDLRAANDPRPACRAGFLRLPHRPPRPARPQRRAASRTRPPRSRAAVAAGYGIEIDLQLSADGEAMVFHDETLDRLTDETGPVSARTAAELGRHPR